MYGKLKNIPWFNAAFKSGSSLLDQAVVSGGNFFTILVCARLLAVDVQGQFGYVLAGYVSTTIFNMMAIFQWASVHAPNHLNKEEYRSDLARIQILYAVVLSVLVVTIIGFIGRFSHWHMSVPEAAFFCLYLFFQQVADFDRRFAYIVSGGARALKSSLPLHITRLLLLVLLHPSGILEVLILLTLATLAPAAMTLKYALSGNSRYREFKGIVKSQLFNSRWLMASWPFVWLWGSLPVFLMGGLLSMEMVGVFITVRSLACAGNVGMELLETEVAVKAGKAFANSRNELGILLRKVRFLGLVVWAFVFCFLVIFGKDLLQFLYGSSYSQYSSLMAMLWIASGITFFFRLNEVKLRTTGFTPVVAFAYGCGVVIIILTSYPIVLYFGIFGGGFLVCLGAIGVYIGQLFFETLIISYRLRGRERT